MRYSIWDIDTGKVEFKFSGLTGSRNATSQELLTNRLHKEAASVLLSDSMSLTLPAPRVAVTNNFREVRIVDKADRTVNFHIFDIKRQFLDEGVFSDSTYEEAWKKRRIGGQDEGGHNAALLPLVLSLPIGFKPSGFFEAPSRDERVLREELAFCLPGVFSPSDGARRTVKRKRGQGPTEKDGRKAREPTRKRPKNEKRAIFQ